MSNVSVPYRAKISPKYLGQFQISEVILRDVSDRNPALDQLIIPLGEPLLLRDEFFHVNAAVVDEMVLAQEGSNSFFGQLLV